MTEIDRHKDWITDLNGDDMHQTVKFYMMLADLIVQEASTNFTFSIPLEDECVNKNFSGTSSIQYYISMKLGMSEATRIKLKSCMFN